MAQYITVEQVDSLLGSDWAEPAAKPLAVQMANDWMTAQGLPAIVADERITRAGAYLAKMAAAGTLFASSEGVIKSSRVKAEGVEVDETFADGSRPVNGDMEYIKTLLSPWLTPFGANVRILGKL